MLCLKDKYYKATVIVKDELGASVTPDTLVLNIYNSAWTLLHTYTVTDKVGYEYYKWIVFDAVGTYYVEWVATKTSRTFRKPIQVSVQQI